MSQGNSAAIRRRAGINTPTLTSQSTQSSQAAVSRDSPNGLTLQQVISMIGSRLTTLETFMNNTNDPSKQVRFTDESESSEGEVDVDSTIRSIFDEFNHRFELLAKEIGDLKDIVIKLQSFTMDVNKTLMQERIQVFSDMDSHTYTVDDIMMPTDTIENALDYSQIADSLDANTLAVESPSAVSEDIVAPATLVPVETSEPIVEHRITASIVEDDTLALPSPSASVKSSKKRDTYQRRT